MKSFNVQLNEKVLEKLEEIASEDGGISYSQAIRKAIMQYGTIPTNLTVNQPKNKPEKEEKPKKEKELSANDKKIKEMFIPKKVCYVCKEHVDHTKLVEYLGDIVSACDDCIKSKNLKEPLLNF